MSFAPALSQRFADADGTPKLLRLMEALLLALLAVQAARLLWLLLPVAPIGQAAPGPAPAAASLPRTDLFHRGDAPATAAATDISGYSLRGVRVGADGGSAILVDAGNRQHSYAVGERIAPGLTLEAVGPGHVVLRGASGTQRLELPAIAPSPAIGALPAALPASRAAAPAPADPAAVFAQAGLSPREGGGYTVNPRGDANMLRATGLKAGDVIEAVNGTTLNAENLATLPGELASGQTLTFRIRRDGQTRSITVPTRP